MLRASTEARQLELAHVTMIRASQWPTGTWDIAPRVAQGVGRAIRLQLKWRYASI
jgi:hypothetical protein